LHTEYCTHDEITQTRGGQASFISDSWHSERERWLMISLPKRSKRIRHRTQNEKNGKTERRCNSSYNWFNSDWKSQLHAAEHLKSHREEMERIIRSHILWVTRQFIRE
jgi:hypothetical protein